MIKNWNLYLERIENLKDSLDHPECGPANIHSLCDIIKDLARHIRDLEKDIPIQI